MKTLYTTVVLIATLVLGLAGNASASCTYDTIRYPSGRTVYCTTCCYFNQCNTTCH